MILLKVSLKYPYDIYRFLSMYAYTSITINIVKKAKCIKLYKKKIVVPSINMATGKVIEYSKMENKDKELRQFEASCYKVVFLILFFRYHKCF